MKKIRKTPVKKVNLEHKKIAASIFAANVISAVVPYSVFASEITSSAGGIMKTGNTYNITADKIQGSTGFREYEKFNLTKGDIANLQFIKNSREYSKFVNLVDNQININGIVNTMKGNNFYNGHAVFVSPGGIVIGSSGVLNVGSLTMMAPSQNAYNMFKNNYNGTHVDSNEKTIDNIVDFEFDLGKENYKNLIRNSSGTIEINGKIFARGDVNAYARTINIAPKKSGDKTGIFAGWQDTNTVFDNNTKTDELFNTLVNNNITNADGFSLKDGKITLVTNKQGSETVSYSTFETKKDISKTKQDYFDELLSDTLRDAIDEILAADDKWDTVLEKLSDLKDWCSEIIDDIEKFDESGEEDLKNYLSNLDINSKLNELLSGQNGTNNNTNNGSNNSGNNTINNDTYNWLKDFSTKKEVKYETITSLKTDNGLKTVQVKVVKPDKEKKDSLGQTAVNWISEQLETKDANETAEYTIDQSFTKKSSDNPQANEVSNEDFDFKKRDNSLSESESLITITDSFIAANDIKIEANDNQSKSVSTDTIKTYNDAVAKAKEKSNKNNENSNSNNTNNTDNNNTKEGNKDETTGYTIHELDYGAADEAKSKIVIKNSKISGDNVSIQANAKSTTSTYVQLIDPIFEKWINMLVSGNISSDFSDAISQAIKDYGDIEVDFSTEGYKDNDVAKAISEYFSNGIYSYFDGSKASAALSIEDSIIKAVTKYNITSNAEANSNFSTGRMDSVPVFMYGLGSETNSEVKISNSTITNVNKGADTAIGSSEINAYSKINNSLSYNSSDFLTVTEKPEEQKQEDNKDKNKDDNNDNNKDKGNEKQKEQKYESTTSLYNLTILNNSVVSNTNVKIENSTVNAADLNIRAIGYNKDKISITNVSNVGKETEHSGIAVGLAINHTDTNTNIDIKGSNIKTSYEIPEKVEVVTNDDGTQTENVTTYGHLRLASQNINQFEHTVSTEVKPAAQAFEVKPKELPNYDPGYTIQIYEKLNDKFLNKLTDKMQEGLDKVDFQLSGSAIWNNENNSSKIVIEKSDTNNTKIYARTVDISSDVLDFTLNTAKTNASADSKWGAGAAIIINDQNNTNLAHVTNETEITALDKVKVNATTQMPMNTLYLRLGQDLDGYKYVGFSFDQDSETLDPALIYSNPVGFLSPDVLKALWGKIKSPRETLGSFELKMDGLFNNLAQSQASAETADIAGSIVINTIKNDTNAVVDRLSSLNVTGSTRISKIDGSTILNGGSVIINAVNDCISYNGAGDVKFLIEDINTLISKIKKDTGKEEAKKEAAKYGVGGTVLIGNYTNNAEAKIDNSYVSAKLGDVKVLSANEEGYLNLAVTGGAASKLAIEGTVNIQNIDGSTKAFIENESIITAKTVNVNAGEALIKTKNTDNDFGEDSIKFNGREIKKNDERTALDRLININLIGTNATQETVENEEEGKTNSTSSAGVSIGASVNIANINKQIESYIDNSEITTTEDITVEGKTDALNINFIEASATAGGVHVNKLKQEEANKKAEENKKDETKTEEQKKTEEKENGQDTKNVGNWMDMLDAADDDAEDVMNLNNLFVQNDASEKAQKSVKDKKDAIKTADKNVDKDGNTKAPKYEEEAPPAGDGEKDKSNTEALTDNDNKKLEGDDNKKADLETAKGNFSAAAAGAVSVINDNTKVTARITNSNKIKSGKDVNVETEKNAMAINFNGGLAKAGNVAAGAGVNVYGDKAKVKSYIDNSTITFTGDNLHALNVTANNTESLYSLTAGVGAATDDQKNFKTAIGGSFSWNTLKNETSAKLNKVTVQKENNAQNPDITVEAADDSTIWNITGAVAYANAKSKVEQAEENGEQASEADKNAVSEGQGTGVGVGIAASVDYSNKKVNAEIIDSTLIDVQNVTVNADLNQDYNTIAASGAVIAGTESSYTFDGAVNTEVSVNDVRARIGQGYTYDNQGNIVEDSEGNIIKTGIGTTIKSNGQVVINSNSNIDNSSLAGAVSFSTSSKGAGVGLGAIVNVNNSDIIAEADKLTVQESNSINIQANEDEKYQFLAANLGFSNGSHVINVNGISNVLVSDVLAQSIGESVLNSTGNVGINSVYTNELKGITIAGGASMEGSAVGANLIANIYNNNVASLLDKDSVIVAAGDAEINARAIEDLDIIPVGVSLSLKSAAVAANINANVIVDTITSQVFGEIKNSSNVLVNASDFTSLKTRGGTLALSGSSAIGGNVNVDVLDKTVTAGIKTTKVNSTGKVDVLASSINSIGGVKVNVDENSDEYTYEVASMNDANKFTEKKNEKYTPIENNSSFADWNMFYDVSAGSKAAVSGAIVVKVIDNTVSAYIENTNVNADELNVIANDYTVTNAVIGRISAAGQAAVGANIFVLAGSSDVQAKVIGGNNAKAISDTDKAHEIHLENKMSVAANSTKQSTLITVGGGAAGTASINGSAVANVIKDVVTAKIGDNVSIETASLDVMASSNNDLKGLLVNASFAGTAAVGAAVYINEQDSKITAQIGENEKIPLIIKAINNIDVQAKADDSFRALLANVNASGTAAVGGMGILNFINSDVKSSINNANVTSEQGRVDVIADRGFNRNEAGSSNIFRNWFKDSAAYQSQKTRKNDKEEDISGLDKSDLDKLAPIVGAVSVSGSGTAAVAATVVSNKIEGTVTSEVKESTVSTSNGLTVKANEAFVNYDAVASVAGAGTGAGVSGVAVINLLEDTITSQIVNSTIEKGKTDVSAKSTMNLNQLVISGSGTGVGAGVNATVDYNEIDDKVHSYITNSTVNDDTNVEAQHAIEINNILVAGSFVGEGAAVNIIPVLNNYAGETIASINSDSTVNSGAITVNAYDNIDNFSAVVGIAGGGIGASVGGYVIRNNYKNDVFSNIDGAVINTSKTLDINADSIINAQNALLSGGLTGVGGTLTANVIINDVETEIASYINNSTVTKAGAINLNTNKDKEDIINNLAGSVSVAGVGGAGNVNSIFNFYEGVSKTYIDNTSITKADSLSVNAYGNRLLETTDIGGAGVGIGGAASVNAIVNQINSKVWSFVDADDKTVDIAGTLIVNSESTTKAMNKSGIVTIAGAGTAIGANIGLHNYDDMAKTEILSGETGTIIANNVDADANSIYGVKNDTVNVSAGAGSLAGDVTLINLGKPVSTYSDAETAAKADEAVTKIKEAYDKVSDDNKFKTTGSNEPKTGTIARSNANLEITENVSISSDSKLQGLKDNRSQENGKLEINGDLILNNETIQGGAAAANVGVKVVKLNNNSLAELAGGKIESSNEDTKISVSVSSNSENKVQINNFEASASGMKVAGAAGIYKNSALTQAIINNANIINANTVDVTALSNNKSVIDNQSYMVSGANIGVSILDNQDTNNTYALVSGNTNINADILNLHATGNTELSSSLKTVTISGFNVQYLSNNTDAHSITKAMIENAAGTMNLGELKIIADTSKMSTLAKSNLTGGSIVGVTIGEAGSFMNAEISAGINSPTKENSKNNLIINNTGATTILSGVSADDNTKAADITAEAKIIGLSVGVASAADSEAIAKNNVKVNTKLIANEHNADSLLIKALMNESGNANVDSQSYGVVSVNVSSVKSYIDANLEIDVSGKNTIVNKAEIIANNNAAADINMAVASGGAINVGTSNLYSNLNSNTTLNIGGYLNAKEIEINSDTQRYSKMDYASKGGGAISVNAANADNNVAGTSVFNLSGYKSSSDYENKLNIKHSSTNTQDTVSNSVSGGFISANSINVAGSLTSTTAMNIYNKSDINTKSDLNFEVTNKNVIKDSSSSANYGAVAITKNDVEHNYSSGTKIAFDDAKISAKNVNVKAVSEVKTENDSWVNYAGSSGGFIAGNTTTLTNNINQSSEIEFTSNSELHADNNAKLEALTNSLFKQKTDSGASGFVTVPKGVNYLNADNANKITISSGSTVSADNTAILNFDSNNTLYAYSKSDSSNFAGNPTAKSYVKLIIENELNNNGTLKAGNLIDINYMNNSTNELNQYARTVAEAAVATSSQDGRLSRTYNNSLNVAAGGLISSNKDIDINYSNGSEKLASEISYKSVSRLLFGIPITATGNKENISKNSSNVLQLDGDIAAGQGNNKYIKINSDGTVDKDTLLGFATGTYALSGTGTVDGEKLKEETLNIIQDKISNIGSRISVLEDFIEEEKEKIKELKAAISENTEKLTEINQYTLKTLDLFNAAMDNDYKLLVRQALVQNGDVDKDNNVTVNYITIINDYKAYILDRTDNIPTITEFINSHDTYKNLTDAQKTIFQNNYNTVQSKLSESPVGKYTIYDNKYMLALEVTLTDGTEEGLNNVTYENDKTYLEALNNSLNSQLDVYKENKSNNEIMVSLLTYERDILQNDYDIKSAQDANQFSEPYNIAFCDMESESSGINIRGISESNIKGSGNFKTSSSALTVDNYSTRSLEFGSIDLDSNATSGLTINGKNYADYLDKTDNIIGSETGVHFVSNGEGGNGNITINNYFDVTNPFASTLNDVQNNTSPSNICFNNRVSTGGNINVYNESGDITFDSGISANKKTLKAVNGDINIGNSNVNMLLKENDAIFAGGDVNINANEADIKGNITSGYSARNLTITDDMLSNLVLDKTTGEENLINIEGTDNNIKAIYKDGEIYVFSISNDGGAVNISANNGSITANVSSKDGYQTIAINNRTDKKLNIYNISNNNHTGGFSASEGLSITEDKLTSNNVNKAQTSITSEKSGRISLKEAVENSFNSFIADKNGTLDIKSNNGIDFDLNSNITAGGTVNIVNNSNGINIEGKITNKEGNILISNKNSDITIGEYDSENDNYINNENGNVNIDIINGNLLNGIVDEKENNNHSNYDLGNPDKSYKTLISSQGDLIISVTDGDIGITNNENPGFSIDSSTRDFIESININVLGDVYAKAVNGNKNDTRLVNIRAKESDLNAKDITSDGNVILTAADWKQADEKPTPDNKEYLIGYSVNNAADKGEAAVNGQNISIIASNNIGTKDNKLIYKQDTLNAPDSSVSFEAENALNITGQANSDNETKIYQLVTKKGDIGLDLESDAIVKEIAAGGGLNITQKAERLTLIDLSMPISREGSSNTFADILEPHDNIAFGGNGSTDYDGVIPNYVNIKVLDAIDTPERSNAALKIYNAYVKGNHGENTQYYPDGSRLADVTLMADNIYVNSAKAPSSTITGFTPADKTYSPADFGDTDTNVYEAHGINGWGEGEPVSIDILGVDRDIVEELVDNPQRNNYEMQLSVSSTPNKFKNAQDRLPFYNYDFRAKNVVLSIDDYVNTNRGVSIDTLYANNAYINTKDTNFAIEDGYIKNYAELRNADKLAVVDNDNIRNLKQTDIQLYTKDTGSFNLYLNNTINMISNAPALYNNPDMLVNGYHSAWNFVDRGTKETQVVLNNMQDIINPQIQLLNDNTIADYNIASANNELEIIANVNKDYDIITAGGEDNNNEVKVNFKTSSPTFIVFDTMGELSGLNSDVKIYSISTTGAITSNEQGWSKGDKVSLNLTIDGLDVVIPSRVISINGSTAKLEFTNMPRSLANKLLYKYMQANSEEINLTAL